MACYIKCNYAKTHCLGNCSFVRSQRTRLRLQVSDHANQPGVDSALCGHAVGPAETDRDGYALTAAYVKF